MIEDDHILHHANCEAAASLNRLVAKDVSATGPCPCHTREQATFGVNRRGQVEAYGIEILKDHLEIVPGVPCTVRLMPVLASVGCWLLANCD